jgi:hypothetical protein
MSKAPVADLTQERFQTPEQVAALVHRTVQWVYNNSLPESGFRKAGFLFPAAVRFNRKTLLFDREKLEQIIEAASGVDHD